jgi:hypothetical protein
MRAGGMILGLCRSSKFSHLTSFGIVMCLAYLNVQASVVTQAETTSIRRRVPFEARDFVPSVKLPSLVRPACWSGTGRFRHWKGVREKRTVPRVSARRSSSTLPLVLRTPVRIAEQVLHHCEPHRLGAGPLT